MLPVDQAGELELTVSGGRVQHVLPCPLLSMKSSKLFPAFAISAIPLLTAIHAAEANHNLFLCLFLPLASQNSPILLYISALVCAS